MINNDSDPFLRRAVLRAEGNSIRFDTMKRMCHHLQRFFSNYEGSAKLFSYLGNFSRFSNVSSTAELVRIDDERLIRETLNGDPSAFGDLVRRYQDRLFHTVFRLVGNTEDALDVVQEAFLNAYQSLRSFKGDALFFTWLYRIAMNNAISLNRKRRATVRISGSEGNGTAEPADPSAYGRPGHDLELLDEEKRIQKALSQLSQEHRAVLILKDMDGQKYEAMAQILSVPVGTIRSRLHRARLELREILEKMEN
jgi:RNA polymerase sigma-70 factor (ECF subfamily)